MRQFALPILIVCGFAPLPALANQPEINGGITRLPPFIVTEVPEGLPWKYVRAGDFEVLSLCSDDLTWAFIRAQHLGHLFLPEVLQTRRSAPATIILFSQGAASTPPVEKVDHDPKRWGRGGWHYPGVIAVRDRDSLVISANLERRYDYESVSTVYAHQSLLDATPPPPPWLPEGLFGHYGIFPEVEGINSILGENRIKQPSMLWISDAITDQILDHRKYVPEFESLDRFFNSPPSSSAEDATRFPRWASQAGLFVRWQLYANRGAASNPRAFWEFAYGASLAPVSEQLFSQHFHVDYATAKTEMLSYLREAVRGPIRISVAGLMDRLPELYTEKLRPATATEVARLKGNWERLEAKELATSAPEVAQKYREAASRTFRRGQKHGGENDPALLAVLGLYNYEAGNLAEARGQLETAATANAAGTQALLALAHLRLAEAKSPLEPNARLSAVQLESVLTPLFAARSRSPANAEVYTSIAEAWSQSGIRPTQANLNVLLEGVRLFPRNLELRWQAADLHRLHGYRAEARSLARQGGQMAPIPAQRARFNALETELAGAP